MSRHSLDLAVRFERQSREAKQTHRANNPSGTFTLSGSSGSDSETVSLRTSVDPASPAEASGPVSITSGGRGSLAAVTEMNDLGLIEAITVRVPEALGEAYRRQGSRVYGLVRRMCGQARAEDVVQEVFLRLWQRPERYHAERGSMRSFLLLQAHSLAVDALRSDSARQARDSVDFLSRTTCGDEVEAVALTNLAGAAVARALAALPDRERHPIVLAYFGGYPYRQVAYMLDEPEGTIKSRIRSGLAALRALLGDDQPGSSRE